MEQQVLVEALVIIATALLSFHSGRIGRVTNRAEAILNLTKRVEDLSAQVISLQHKTEAVEDTNRVLWQYIYTLLSQLRKHKIIPPPPPDEIKNDLKLMEIIKGMSQ